MMTEVPLWRRARASIAAPRSSPTWRNHREDANAENQLLLLEMKERKREGVTQWKRVISRDKNECALCLIVARIVEFQ